MRAVQRFPKKAGSINPTPYTLRHVFAKVLIDTGVSREKVATLLRRSTLNTTRIYTTPREEDLEDAVGSIADVRIRIIPHSVVELKIRYNFLKIEYIVEI